MKKNKKKKKDEMKASIKSCLKLAEKLFNPGFFGVVLGATISYFATTGVEGRKMLRDYKNSLARDFPNEHMALEECNVSFRAAVDRVTNYLDARFDSQVDDTVLNRHFTSVREAALQCQIQILKVQMLTAAAKLTFPNESFNTMRAEIKNVQSLLQKAINTGLDRRKPASYFSDYMAVPLGAVQSEWRKALPSLRKKIVDFMSQS